MNVLVTGSEGFVGSILVPALAGRGHTVTTFDLLGPPSASHIQGDIRDFDAVMEAMDGIDAVYHLAAVLGTSELLFDNATAASTNVGGTVNVLEAAFRRGVSRVFYPAKPNPWLNTYSVTKQAAEDFALLYRRYHQVDVRILRWFSAYGPGQKLHPVRKVFPMFAMQALRGLAVEVYGTGQQLCDLVFCDDIAKVTLDYMELDAVPDRVVEMGCVAHLTVSALAQMMCEIAGNGSPVVHLPMRLGEMQDVPVVIDGLATAAEMTGHAAARTAVRDGLERTVSYYADLPASQLDEALEFYYGRIPKFGDLSARTVRQLISFEESNGHATGAAA